MKFGVLGTSDFTLRCTQALIDKGAQIQVMISMPFNCLPNNSVDVGGFAKNQNIPYNELKDINSPQSINFIKAYSLDYIFVSWPKILKKQILDLPKYFCIGTHPTDIPHNKGRHPLHWLISLGIPKTKLSFFKIDEGIDTGNLLLQIPFSITPQDTILNVEEKVNQAGYDGTVILYETLLSEPLYGSDNGQNHILGNYWRMRTPHDITIDLRMSAHSIMRTVNSFASPYPCANLIFEKFPIKIVRASLASTVMTAEQLQRIEPGKIICIKKNTIRVKVDDAILDLECIGSIPNALLKSKYIHPPSSYLVDWSIKSTEKLL
jgi:methionyl-tRNA formyltransferase